jgi:hypothetical protein
MNINGIEHKNPKFNNNLFIEVSVSFLIKSYRVATLNLIKMRLPPVYRANSAAYLISIARQW